jgi:DNA-binding response OmpR family regulator
VVARILIVEDEPVINHALMDVLTEEGHEVLSAGDGKSGIELARKEQPDLILMDLNLPTIDGIAAIRQLRQELPESRPRIIALSDSGTLYDHAAELLADSLIAKPFDLNMVLAEVTVQINRLVGLAIVDEQPETTFGDELLPIEDDRLVGDAGR